MPITSFTASGYIKHRDAKASPQQMTIETQKHVDPSKGAANPVGLIVRVGVAPKEGDRALNDLVENSITLTLSQAVFFASALLAEVAQVQQVLDKRIGKEPLMPHNNQLQPSKSPSKVNTAHTSSEA